MYLTLNYSIQIVTTITDMYNNAYIKNNTPACRTFCMKTEDLATLNQSCTATILKKILSYRYSE